MIQEGSKLLVVPQLYFFHWHDLLDVLFESFQMIHKNLLFLDVLSDFVGILLDLRVWQFQARDLNVNLIPIEDKVSRIWFQLLKRVLDFTFWSEEHLDLRCLADVRKFAQFDQEFVKVELSFLNKLRRHISLTLLSWHGRDEQAWIMIVKVFSEDEELAVSPEAIDLSKAVVALDEIFGMFLDTTTFRFA